MQNIHCEFVCISFGVKVEVASQKELTLVQVQSSTFQQAVTNCIDHFLLIDDCTRKSIIISLHKKMILTLHHLCCNYHRFLMCSF